jgi:hypothetical protein
VSSIVERPPLTVALLVALLAACAPEGTPEVATLPLLPEGYPRGFVQVRDCRASVDHNLGRIVIKVESGLEERYERGPFPMPAGTVIVKEEFADPGCTETVGWTLMRKEAAGYDPRFGDWRWQRLDAARKVLEDGKVARCASCHAATACQARDFACAEP